MYMYICIYIYVNWIMDKGGAALNPQPATVNHDK